MEKKYLPENFDACLFLFVPSKIKIDYESGNVYRNDLAKDSVLSYGNGLFVHDPKTKKYVSYESVGALNIKDLSRYLPERDNKNSFNTRFHYYHVLGILNKYACMFDKSLREIQVDVPIFNDENKVSTLDLKTNMKSPQLTAYLEGKHYNTTENIIRQFQNPFTSFSNYMQFEDNDVMEKKSMHPRCLKKFYDLFYNLTDSMEELRYGLPDYSAHKTRGWNKFLYAIDVYKNDASMYKDEQIFIFKDLETYRNLNTCQPLAFIAANNKNINKLTPLKDTKLCMVQNDVVRSTDKSLDGMNVDDFTNYLKLMNDVTEAIDNKYNNKIEIGGETEDDKILLSRARTIC